MSGDYRFVGVFLVDIGFCSKNEALWLAETFNVLRSPTMYIFNLLFESSNWLFAIFNWDNNSRILIISFLLIHSSSALTSNDFLLSSALLCFIRASVPLPVNFRSTSGLRPVYFWSTFGSLPVLIRLLPVLSLHICFIEMRFHSIHKTSSCVRPPDFRWPRRPCNGQKLVLGPSLEIEIFARTVNVRKWSSEMIVRRNDLISVPEMVEIVFFVRTNLDNTFFRSRRTHSTTWNRSEIKYFGIFNRCNYFSFYLFFSFWNSISSSVPSLNLGGFELVIPIRELEIPMFKFFLNILGTLWSVICGQKSTVTFLVMMTSSIDGNFLLYENRRPIE